MFSTLWIDEPSAEVREEGWLGEALEAFIRDGFVVIRNAIDEAAIDRYTQEFDGVVGTRSGLQIQMPFAPRCAVEDGDPRFPGAKVLDTYRFAPSALAVMLAPRIDAFLRAVFRDDILAFQGLHFEVGSTQAVHQDTAYVVVDERPLNLVASWIALEDLQPGSGELIYYPGSHRWPHYLYGGKKHAGAEFPPELHDRHLAWLHEEAKARGIEKQSFLARKGDVLFWHADLAHGGGEITSVGATRRSLVTHYCPLSETPHYFRYGQFKPERVGANGVVSMYYDSGRFA